MLAGTIDTTAVGEAEAASTGDGYGTSELWWTSGIALRNRRKVSVHSIMRRFRPETFETLTFLVRSQKRGPARFKSLSGELPRTLVYPVIFVGITVGKRKLAVVSAGWVGSRTAYSASRVQRNGILV
jgi:hypothetical protein